ncbi:winged helix-turn-helix domain-containing protein, partial [Burkholderia pseudomallei]
GAPSGIVRLGDIEVDLAGCTVWRLHGECDRQRVELTAREWAVLEALVARAGRLVSKADLEGLILGLERDVTSNVLEVYIGNLRRKLGRSLID